MIICESYMFEFSVDKDLKKNSKEEEEEEREVVVGKVATHLCQTLIVKELKITVKQCRVVTTLNLIKH